MDAFAGKIIEGIASLAVEEFRFIWNLKADQERMKRITTSIKAVLLDAEAKATNNQISNWLEQLKDVLYDADDLLDDFSTEALRSKMIKEMKTLFSWKNKMVYAHKMGRKMKEIRKRLDDIANDRHVLQLRDCSIEPPVSYRGRRQTYSFVGEDEVFGRQKEKLLIKSYLLGNNSVTSNLSVIPIVGIGGLGKTTLAQLVCNDKAVRNYFELIMWVCVSDEFDIRRIAQKMIGHNNNKDCEVEEVQQELRKKIERKKYLLVLDDVWSEDRELWLQLNSLLMEGAKGSMVIVTTRNQKVAKIMGTEPPLFLKGMDVETSWKLFCRVAFDREKEPNDLELVAIGRDIVKKCSGVPLAIRTIGSLLYLRNLGRSDWIYFRDVEFSKIDPQKDEIFAILKLSYDHLPSPLKNCFSYCSLFPKGFMFEKNTVIQLWVAEGFIRTTDDIRSAEDIGHEYFMNLLSMSLFEAATTNDCGDVTAYKMHDLIHDLSLLVVGREYAVVGEKEVNVGKKTRYLSYNIPLFSAATLSSYLLNGDKLRTFHVPRQPIHSSRDLVFSFGSLISLRCLRVLTLRALDITVIPKGIEELKHLRYIDLQGNANIQSLPSEITSLYNLQTLKLSNCSNLKELPADINKMMSLRHIELDSCVSLTCMPPGLEQLTGLQTLTLFVLGHGSKLSLSELSGLNNLRGKLKIKGLNSLRGIAASVESAKVLLQKPHLQELELQWQWQCEEEAISLVSDPLFNRGFKTTIQQEEDGLKDEVILEGLQPHQSIKRLVINGFCGKKLPDWIGNLTELAVLEINNCDGLTSLPEGLRNLKSLQRLCIYSCSQLEESCARNHGDEWNKISHIPKVLILPLPPSLLKYIN
ncbi:putative disease resistance protein RGA1 [Arachis hypogaea]|uniref:putative disease resistance protein RGA1 n=1 Tax=Arachis hypogaea TaxID=3818 RepID=UPI000DED197A|nr:putative disease resistance protein RGA4 [Arachis hypogaea]